MYDLPILMQKGVIWHRSYETCCQRARKISQCILFGGPTFKDYLLPTIPLVMIKLMHVAEWNAVPKGGKSVEFSFILYLRQPLTSRDTTTPVQSLHSDHTPARLPRGEAGCLAWPRHPPKGCLSKLNSLLQPTLKGLKGSKRMIFYVPC